VGMAVRDALLGSCRVFRACGVFLAVIPNPVAGFANEGEGSAFGLFFAFWLWVLALEVCFWRLNMNRTYCVYILASRSRNLYTGVTGNLEPRMVEHRQRLIPGFTTRYRIFRLVYFEFFSDVHAAIAREKEVKGWRREKKIWLIKRNNPTWADLAEKLPHQYQMTDCPKQIPHPRSPKPGDRVRDDKLNNSGRAS
jgi:putative endonuclease